MPQLNVVLVEPRIPQNTGNVARTCAATGARLHLVEPLGFSIDSAKLRRAGLDYWGYLDVTRYGSLPEFLRRTQGEELFFFTTKAQRTYTRTPPGWSLAGRMPDCRRNCSSKTRSAACACPCGRGCGA